MRRLAILRRGGLAALVVTGLAACSCVPPQAQTPTAPARAVVVGAPGDGPRVVAWAYVPPAVYGLWFAEARRCSALPLPPANRGRGYRALHWLVTDAEPPAGVLQTPTGPVPLVRLGQWVAPDTIVLSRARVGDPRVVIHEVLHYLRQRGGHPDVPFATCGVRDDASWLTRQVLAASLGEVRVETPAVEP